MIRVLGLALLVSLPWPLDAAWDSLKPEWVDRTFHNPRERTENALEAAADGDDEAALEAAQTAYDIAPRKPRPDSTNEDPTTDQAGNDQAGNDTTPPPSVDARVAYNAGTAHLAAGHEKRAVELLDEAARGMANDAPELASAAHYNLGTAQLAAGNTAAAIASLKESLRLDPADAAAKHNLEVALRRLEEERKLPLQEPQETPGGENPGEQESGDQGGGAEDETPEEDAGANRPQEQAPTPREDAGEPPQAPPSGLADFEDQPDMTAEQARALLESVENYERRQRQEEAARQQRRQSAARKDW